MNSKGLLIVLSGPSGCGKGTLLKRLLEGEENLVLSVSATTRTPRAGEEHGKDYFFYSHEQFQQLLLTNGFLEHAEYCGNFYGTPSAEIEQWRQQGKDVILEIDVQGALQVKQACVDSVLVFVLPPSLTELKNRLVGRNTEDEETVLKRLQAAKNEISQAHLYDYVICNDILENAVHAAHCIIQAEKYKQSRQNCFVKAMLEQVI